MQDEHFMQSWNEGHSRFSADLDRGLRRVVARLPRRGAGRKANRDPYGIPAETRPALSSGARASLHGLGASALTVVLWVVVLALATPATGLAAAADPAPASCACAAHLPLA